MTDSKKFEISLKQRLKPVFLLVAMLAFGFPHSGSSQVYQQDNLAGPRAEQSLKAYYSGPTLPNIEAREANRTMNIMVTAYNSLPEQTDDTPFITASGTHTRDGIIAANFLPIGAIVRFPDVYGDKEFVVEDRMNKRYYYKADIWMEHKQDALNFGAKVLKMEIL